MKKVVLTILITILMLAISLDCFAQKKRRPTKVPTEAPTTIFEPNADCSPIDQKALVIISESGNWILGASKIEKPSLAKELRNYVCGKIPPEQIVFIEANFNLSFSEVVEVIRLGRKAGADDFGLKLSNNSELEILVKVPEEETPTPKKIKAHPLTLTVSLDNQGKLKLNNKSETLDSLKQKLQQIFLTRKQKRIYIMGSKEVDKTVFIYADGAVKFGEVVNLLREIEKLGAFPIGLDVDEYFLKTMFLK